jgi:hypothetical protein
MTRQVFYHQGSGFVAEVDGRPQRPRAVQPRYAPQAGIADQQFKDCSVGRRHFLECQEAPHAARERVKAGRGRRSGCARRFE